MDGATSSQTRRDDMTYIAGFLTPVPNGNKEAYIESARKAWSIFKEYGALQ
ncbi:DUF1428 family protein, partial [uncultured Roseovarius sp.]|uniref:DUF1428 family protein n=1 Tax=uncultured Roseovarius sp. TaxID=293344 RepID=UPI003422CC04